MSGLKLHYRPADGYFGDAIPFYWEGEYHLFYLKATRKGEERLLWAHIVSSDLVNWQELPEALLPGEANEPDGGGCWTGSVIEKEGVFHIFYTGWHPHHPKGPQTICHATSPDLVHWVKDGRNPLLEPDLRWYGKTDWRDPFVFWHPEKNCYVMLICATTNRGPEAKRGCLALATSPDLERWEIRPPFWAPNFCGPMECPDLFYFSGRWYLVFSEFTDTMQTHYRIADKLSDPWRTPEVDTFNGPRFYAAKTAGDDKRRFAFAWLPTREGDRDDGAWRWGGHLAIPHELVAGEDGSLFVRCPKEVLKLTGEGRQVSIKTPFSLGTWKTQGERIYGERLDGLTYALFADTPQNFRLSGQIHFLAGTRAFGLLLRTAPDYSAGYLLRFEPSWHRVVFDRFPRGGDVPPLVERPLLMAPKEPLAFHIFVEGTMLEAFFNDRLALSCRLYERSEAPAGLFVLEGAAVFERLRVAHLSN